MKNNFLLLLFLLTVITCSSQNVFTQQKDSAEIKMKKYMLLIGKADAYQQKAEYEISKATFYKSEARRLLDSAYIAAKKGEIDKKNSQIYILQFNLMFGMTEKYTKKADSIITLASFYKDSAVTKNREAESYYLQLTDDCKPIIESETLKKNIYVVQIGAGKMERNYFDKVSEVRVITPKDGISRYIVGEFDSKKAALEYRNKMIAIGYEDAFIRTMDSLQK